MNCSDELRLQKLLDDRHEMDRLQSRADYLIRASGRQREKKKGQMQVDLDDLEPIVEAALVLLSEKLESAL